MADLVLLDQTSNGNDLTNSGVASSANLPFATNNVNAADFEATEGDYFTAPDSASLSIIGNMTLMLWVKFESLPADTDAMAFFGKRTGVGQFSYAFKMTNDIGGADPNTYTLDIELSSDGANRTTKSVSWTPSTGVWYNVAVVYTAAGGTADFYVNGVAQGSQQSGLPTSIYDSTSILELGVQNNFSFFDGVMDDVRVYNTARTSGAISGDYNQELVGNESGLVAYWPFETVVVATDEGIHSKNPASIQQLKFYKRSVNSY